MVCCVVVAVQYYINIQYRECTKDPLVYAAKTYEKDYGYPFSGSGTFIREGVSPIIYFDAEGIEIITP